MLVTMEDADGSYVVTLHTSLDPQDIEVTLKDGRLVAFGEKKGETRGGDECVLERVDWSARVPKRCALDRDITVDRSEFFEHEHSPSGTVTISVPLKQAEPPSLIEF